MSATIQAPRWPTDPGHRDAIDMLLEMAGAEKRWGDHGRALVLLDEVEQIVGRLSPDYERMRRLCEQRSAARAPTMAGGVQFPHAVVAPTRRGGGRLPGR